ncbi:hypothetical protein [Georgenia sp. SYP-B2076]|uniref:hypothetical protein n=1 Tax=Georgenia sp. SYP-B2076 TaxID=2495881 RepID=UPI0013DFA093|nr:hypothetical protein [Georgenia sp. SYP-B2076]
MTFLMALLIVLAVLLAAAYTAYLLRVIGDDDRGHAFTHRAAPGSHATHDSPADH